MLKNDYVWRQKWINQTSYRFLERSHYQLVFTMSATLVVNALFIGFYGVRIVLRRVFSVLDNDPGSPRISIVTGRRPGSPHHFSLTTVAGNLAQFHDPDDWGFQKQLEENYGGMVKIHGILGVSQKCLVSTPYYH